MRSYLASVIVTLALAIPAAAQQPADSASRVHIDNFGQVSATYYRGAQPHGHDYADLAALGVKTVINLTSDDAAPDEAALTKQAGMKYVQIPMTTHEPPTAAQLAAFFQIVNDPASQPVYVHCVGGRHRTGVMTAMYRITDDGWTGERAFQEMKQYKFGSDFLHPEFKAFVVDYHAAAANAAPATTTAAKKADVKP